MNMKEISFAIIIGTVITVVGLFIEDRFFNDSEPPIIPVQTYRDIGGIADDDAKQQKADDEAKQQVGVKNSPINVKIQYLFWFPNSVWESMKGRSAYRDAKHILVPKVCLGIHFWFPNSVWESMNGRSASRDVEHRIPNLLLGRSKMHEQSIRIYKEKESLS